MNLCSQTILPPECAIYQEEKLQINWMVFVTFATYVTVAQKLKHCVSNAKIMGLIPRKCM